MLYQWTAEHCLKMPAVRFFAMLDCGRRLHAAKRMEECEIAYIPALKQDYFDWIRGVFKHRANPQLKEQILFHVEQAERARNEARQDVSNVFRSESEEAKVAVMDLFRAAKRNPH